MKQTLIYIESICVFYLGSVHLILYHGQRRVQQSKRSLNFPIPATKFLASAHEHSFCWTHLNYQFCIVTSMTELRRKTKSLLTFFFKLPLPPTNAPHLTPEDDLNNFKLPLPAEMSTKVTAFLANRGLKRSFNYTCVCKNSKSVKSTPPKDTYKK